ncbi:Cell division protein FtsX [Candidatus Magnetomoraceae bacterium gMMP-15]
MKKLQILFFFKGAIRDFFNNSLLHTITIITIALSLLVICSFSLFFINISEIMNSWREGIRIMAYLEQDIKDSQISNIKEKILNFEGVRSVVYISEKDAMTILKNQMRRHSGLLENLKQNPLPSSYEIKLTPSNGDWNKIENLAAQIESLPKIKEVEYGKGWLDKISTFFNIFRITCFAIGGLLLITTLFVVANTIRLVLYSRREEIEIMRLVGATSWFIKIPLYLEGMIQGLVGGILGLGTLFLLFFFIFSKSLPEWSQNIFHPHFFSFITSFNIIIGSMIIGWLGCYLSLKQFLRV